MYNTESVHRVMAEEITETIRSLKVQTQQLNSPRRKINRRSDDEETFESAITMTPLSSSRREPRKPRHYLSTLTFSFKPHLILLFLLRFKFSFQYKFNLLFVFFADKFYRLFLFFVFKEMNTY